MKIKFYALLFFGLSLFSSAFAQSTITPPNEIPFCPYVPDSVTAAITKDLISKMYKNGNKSNQRTQAIYKIPVVVHVMEPSTSSSLITDAQIATVISNLNAAYRGTGAFTGSPDIEIEFELAHWSPDCQATTGITRYDASGNATYVANGVFGNGVTWDQVQSWRTWQKSSYMNIWVVEKMGNGAAGVGGPADGFIALASEIKRSFDYVSAHEVGHYLGVAHPFPDYVDNCGCADGDGLVDTPNLVPHGIFTAGQTGCGHESGCTATDMAKINPCTGSAYGMIQKNIMNYTNYQCSVTFTNDQKNLMRAMMENYHTSLLTSPALSATQPTPAAQLTGPSSFCASDGNYPAIRAVCTCGTVQEIKINNTVYPESYLNNGIRPVLSPGQSTQWTYQLTCSNGQTASKTVDYYNVGVTSLSALCTNTTSYQLNFTNPNNYTLAASAGTLSSNAVTNIANSTQQVSITSTDGTGCQNVQTVERPCCSTGTVALVNCVPTAANGLGNFFGIGQFEFGSVISKISGTSASDNATYVDNACSNTGTLSAATVQNFKITAVGTNQHYVKMWIDYNNDGTFDNLTELVANAQTPGSSNNFYSGSVTIPVTAVRNVPLRIRVLADFVSSSTACNIAGYNTGRVMTNYGSGQIEDYSITVTNPLPVDLISFKGTSNIQNIDLEWKTASEKSNKGFGVLRSLNGVDFNEVGYIDGKGTTSETKTYTFTDTKVEPGQSYYYQLNQVDLDGSSERSRIIYVKSWYQTLEATVYPNPTSTGEFVINHPQIGDYDITLYAISGMKMPIQASSGATTSEKRIKGIGKLAPGLYIVQLRNSNGLADKSVSIVIR